MVEHPILFKDRLVRALLREREPKTETRRVGPAAKRWLKAAAGDTLWVRESWMPLPVEEVSRLRSGGMTPGPWSAQAGGVLYRATTMAPAFDYLAAAGHRWKPSIHMPRRAARVALVLSEKPWVESLQSIQEKGAVAEGVERFEAKQSVTGCGYWGGVSRWLKSDEAERSPGRYNRHNTACYVNGEAVRTAWVNPRDAFASLWDDVNAARGYGWDANPEVVVLRFKRVQP